LLHRFAQVTTEDVNIPSACRAADQMMKGVHAEVFLTEGFEQNTTEYDTCFMSLCHGHKKKLSLTEHDLT
jgi:hypothetical protein